MRILAADIGGTNARFAAVEISDLSERSMGQPLVIPTPVSGTGSFRQLLERFRAEAPAGMAQIERYDGVALGVA
ncbi:MAG: glucokinase, partial [Xanthomonadales bacterium]|nr:glucokinase [Xanthomonadales bacterium]